MTQSDATLIDSASGSSDLILGEGLLDSQDGTWTEASGQDAALPALMTQTKAIVIVLSFGFIWASMNWGIQQFTSAPTLWKETSMWAKDLVFRFLIDWSFASGCFAILNTRVLSILFAANLWVATAVLSFFLNYQRSLSWMTITSQSGEGLAVAMVALEDAAPYLALLVPMSIALVVAYHRLRPRIGKQKRVAWAAAGVWFAVVLGMHLDHKPLHRLERFETADGIAHSYGYAMTWAAESYYIDYEGITEGAIKRLEVPVDRLIKVAPSVELGDRLAIVQVESLDDAIMNFEIGGRQVVPRLNKWAAEGNYMRVQAPKKNGSCDSDFSLLFGALPTESMAPYRVPGFPFNRSLVNVLHDRGLRTSFFHGVNGAFFERRSAFAEMNFDRVVFREELIKELNIEDPEWTIEDGRMFDAATQSRSNDERFLEFSITGTSHTPFRFSLEDFEREFFPNEHHRSFTYFDTISYVDHVIGEYVDGLPSGTVVMIYGDHWSRVRNEQVGYDHTMIDEFGIVPTLMFRKTPGGIKPLLELDEKLAKSAKLRLVDVTAWLRHSLDIAPATKPYEGAMAAVHQPAAPPLAGH